MPRAISPRCHSLGGLALSHSPCFLGHTDAAPGRSPLPGPHTAARGLRDVSKTYLTLKELADTIFVNYFKDGFFVEKAAFSMSANAWQHQFQQIEICGEKIVLFAVIEC